MSNIALNALWHWIDSEVGRSATIEPEFGEVMVRLVVRGRCQATGYGRSPEKAVMNAIRVFEEKERVEVA